MARQFEREEMNPFMDLELKWGAEDALANVTDKQSPAPAQVASAEPQSVSESDNLLDTAYRALGYKSGMGKYKDIEVGASPAHPLLSQFGMVDNQREQKIQELMEAQSHIRDMVLKASKKKIDNLINPKDISDPNVPAGIKPTMDQTMAGFQKPTFDLPDVSTPQSSPLYPENQTLPQPRGPMNDLQEALMDSVIAGHLTPSNGNLEPTSLVAAQGRLASPEMQDQYFAQLDDMARKLSGEQPSGATGDAGDAINMEPVDVTSTPMSRVAMPPSLVTSLGSQYTQMANKKQENPGTVIHEGRGPDGKPGVFRVDKRGGAARPVEGIAPKDTQQGVDQARVRDYLISMGAHPEKVAVTAQEVGPDNRPTPNAVMARGLISKAMQAAEAQTNRENQYKITQQKVAENDYQQNMKPLDKDAQLWRNAETGEAAPPGLTPAKAKEQGYINIEPQQIQTVTQINNVDAGLDAVTKAANKLVRNATGYTLIDAPAGVLQSSWLSVKRVAGNKDLADLESAIARITPGMAKLGGDTGNVAVAEREIYAKSIFGDHDTVESVLSKVSAIRNANGNTLKNIGLKPKQAQAGNVPEVGTVKKGYRFKGGDPSKQESWEKAD